MIGIRKGFWCPVLKHGATQAAVRKDGMNIFFCQLIFFCISCILRAGQYYFYELEFLSLRKGEGNEKAGFVCVFLLALVTGVFAMAREPVYGVLFIPKKEYTLKRESLEQLYPSAGGQFYRREDAGKRVRRGGEGGQ